MVNATKTFLIIPKNPLQMHLKLPQKEQLLIKLQVSRTSPQNNLETVKNAHNKEIPKERYISPVEWQKIIDDL